MNKAEAIAAHPDFPWLAVDDLPAVERLLARRGWLEPGERVTACGRAGEGNMNLTLRVRTDRRSLVLKQARPWVEKYDHIAAPWERGDVERRFYETVAPLADVASRMPRLLAADAAARVIVLEDLPDARDLASVYRDDSLSDDELAELGRYAAALHAGTMDAVPAELANRAMRELNHQHIFVLPLSAESGIDLEQFEPGLTAAAAELRGDAAYCAAVAETGQRYLADGQVLVHGDFFPGSWLRSSRGLKVIDPEFCFPGDGEFDLAIAIAHFALADAPQCTADALLAGYTAYPGAPSLDRRRLARFASIEVMRRLIGVAQLPLPPRGGRRCALLRRSRHALLEERWEALWPE